MNKYWVGSTGGSRLPPPTPLVGTPTTTNNFSSLPTLSRSLEDEDVDTTAFAYYTYCVHIATQIIFHY